jgi:CheY-like chemotaxis protein
VAKNKDALAGMRCLVLDDEFLIALDIQAILENAGAASVACVASADEALKALRAGQKFDLAVLDLKLGGAQSTSVTVAAELTSHKTPFLFLTGASADDGELGKYPHAPVVEKPYQAMLLLEAVGRALAAR